MCTSAPIVSSFVTEGDGFDFSNLYFELPVGAGAGSGADGIGFVS